MNSVADRNVVKQSEANIDLDNIRGLRITPPKKNLMRNYKEMKKSIKTFVQTVDSQTTNWFYLVCKPFNESYSKLQDWFKSDQWYKNVSRKLTKLAPDNKHYCVKEKDSIKHHLNFLINTSSDLMEHCDSNKYRCRWHIQKLDLIIHNNKLYGSVPRVAKYMIKESKIRYLKPDIDHWTTKSESSGTRCETNDLDYEPTAEDIAEYIDYLKNYYLKHIV